MGPRAVQRKPIMNITFILLTVALSVSGSTLGLTGNDADRFLSKTNAPATLTSTACNTNLDDEADNIKAALQHLSSGEYSRIQLGRTILLANARKCPACRQRVVQALMTDMDKQSVNIERDMSDYYLWREGSILLGNLKATE